MLQAILSRAIVLLYLIWFHPIGYSRFTRSSTPKNARSLRALSLSIRSLGSLTDSLCKLLVHQVGQRTLAHTINTPTNPSAGKARQSPLARFARSFPNYEKNRKASKIDKNKIEKFVAVLMLGLMFPNYQLSVITTTTLYQQTKLAAVASFQS